MYKVKEGCPGCGACVGTCPVKAIKIKGINAVISNDCIDCGACSYACPVKLIEPSGEDKPAAKSSTDKKVRQAEKPEERNGDS